MNCFMNCLDEDSLEAIVVANPLDANEVLASLDLLLAPGSLESALLDEEEICALKEYRTQLQAVKVSYECRSDEAVTPIPLGLTMKLYAATLSVVQAAERGLGCSDEHLKSFEGLLAGITAGVGKLRGRSRDQDPDKARYIVLRYTLRSRGKTTCLP